MVFCTAFILSWTIGTIVSVIFFANQARDVPFKEKVSDNWQAGKCYFRQAHYHLGRWADDNFRGIRSL